MQISPPNFFHTTKQPAAAHKFEGVVPDLLSRYYFKPSKTDLLSFWFFVLQGHSSGPLTRVIYLFDTNDGRNPGFPVVCL